MVIAALVTFSILLVAWIVAPTERRTPRIANVELDVRPEELPAVA